MDCNRSETYLQPDLKNGPNISETGLNRVSAQLTQSLLRLVSAELLTMWITVGMHCIYIGQLTIGQIGVKCHHFYRPNENLSADK